MKTGSEQDLNKAHRPPGSPAAAVHLISSTERLGCGAVAPFKPY